MRRFQAAAAAALLLPYAAALAFGGGFSGTAQMEQAESGKRVILSGTGRGYVDAEAYVAGLTAAQMPANFEKEALKAQAVIARTWLYGQMGEADEIREEELEDGGLYQEDGGTGLWKELWNSGAFTEEYTKIQEAVRETAGQALAWEGTWIRPLFHFASTGTTRAGGPPFPYLQAVKSRRDVEAEGYLTVTEWTPEEFESLAGVSWDQVQIVSRDGGGYAQEVQLGSRAVTGDEACRLLGLPSPAFSLEEYEGKVRAVSQGLGHGYGLSQFGAGAMAREGYTAEEILGYYYPGAEIISSEP